MKQSRRNFITKSLLGGMATLGIPAIISSAFARSTDSGFNKKHLIKRSDTILFQGDSITDSGREKKQQLPNNAASFGNGYALMAASSLLYRFPESDLKIYNRGISGNKVFQLAERWEKDCLNLKPNVLSILIGVNDYWHTRGGNYNGTPEIYERDYRKLLHLTVQKLPGIKLVLCEPFYVLNTSAVDQTWIKPMQQYQAAALKLAHEFDAVWIPYQKVFDEAVKHAPATYWTPDGVHPSMAGAKLMAEAWLKAVR